MQDLINRLKNVLMSQQLVEMVDLSKKRTNLPVIVWIDGPRNVPHGNRIKFANDYGNKLTGVELIPMTVSDNPTIPKKLQSKVILAGNDVEKLKQWIILNKDTIEAYGNGEISTDELLEQIKSV